MKQRTKFTIWIWVVVALLSIACTTHAQSQLLDQSLYADRKAHRVGDVVTILIMEHSQGSNESHSETRKDNSVGVQAGGDGALNFLPLTGFSTKNNVDFIGRGRTNRRGQLRGTLTGRIVSIGDNGNFEIEGTREVTINDEKQLMSLSGVVRPDDISTHNTVMSYYISDAKIAYRGKGHADASQKPGWITRFFNWLF